MAAITPLASERYTLELSPVESPEQLIHELTGHGVHVVSLNPVRITLEDYFVNLVGDVPQRMAADRP